MGYTKHFQDSLTIRHTVNYPASKDGGSTTVEHTEPLDFYINVDTDPFDHSVEGCVGSVQTLQASVVAAEVAELEAKRRNSKRLGKSLSDGFFELVCANVDMQAKEEKAMLDSVFQALIGQKDDLLKKQQVMKGDYNRIKERYVDIFNELNKELRNRILSLQEATFRLVAACGKEQERNVNSTLSATVMVGHKENIELQSQICSSVLKQRAANLIQNTKRYIFGNNTLKAKIQAMLLPGQVSETRYVPVLFTETTNSQEGKVVDVYDNHMLQALNVSGSMLKREIAARGFGWQGMEREKVQELETRLKQEVSGNLGNSSHDVRVADLIMRLWNENLPQVLSNR